MMKVYSILWLPRRSRDSVWGDSRAGRRVMASVQQSTGAVDHAITIYCTIYRALSSRFYWAQWNAFRSEHEQRKAVTFRPKGQTSAVSCVILISANLVFVYFLKKPHCSLNAEQNVGASAFCGWHKILSTKYKYFETKEICAWSWLKEFYLPSIKTCWLKP